MAMRTTVPGRLGSPALLALVLASALGIPQAQAGPLVRRYQERQACQQFAGKLQAVSGNPQQAQYVYQQGVLKLVETFGENPCTDIPAPTAAAPTAAPGPPLSPSGPKAAQCYYQESCCNKAYKHPKAGQNEFDLSFWAYEQLAHPM